MSKLVPLVEIVQSSGVRVDRGAGVIYGVKVLGYQSANGRCYSRQAVRKARDLYEGTHVNIDHPSPGRPDDGRKVADRFGRLQNVRETESGLFADLHYLKSHPLAEMTAEAAERMPETLGLSHNAEGRVSRHNGTVVVEEIVRVRSVDLVSDPATTRSLFESEELMDATTAKTSDGTAATDPTDEKPVHKNVEPLEEEIRRLRARDEVRNLLEAEGIRAEPPLVEALVALPTSEARRALLAVWPKQAAGCKPRSASPLAEWRGDIQLPTDGKSFATALL